MPKTIMKLTPSDCRFILDERSRKGSKLYCADAVIPGESFCPHHQRICYGAALPRRRNMVSQVGFDLAPLAPPAEPEHVPDLVEALAA